LIKSERHSEMAPELLQLLTPAQNGPFVPFTICGERSTVKPMETNLSQRQDNRPRYVSLSDALQSRITRNAKGPSFSNRTVGALVYRNPRARKRQAIETLPGARVLGTLKQYAESETTDFTDDTD
jgi:hypothetical protein